MSAEHPAAHDSRGVHVPEGAGHPAAPGEGLPRASSAAQTQRDPACVERWPECESGSYDPRCCRFPKSCSCTSYPPDDPPAAQRQRDALEAAFDGVEDARMIVGQFIPATVREWGEHRGLEVRETQFAPPGRIFIVGAVPIPELNGIMRDA